MDKKSYIKLEFDKILNMLSDSSVIEPNKKRALLLEPMNNIEEINASLNDVNDAQTLIIKRGNPPIYAIKDVVAHIKRLDIGGMLHTNELLDIAKLLKTVRLLKEYSSEDNELSSYFDDLIILRGLEEEISSKILSEDEIADNASIKLYSIRKKIAAANNKIKEILNKFVISPTYQKYLQENIVTMRGDRYVLPVKIEHKGDIPGIVHDTSSSGSTVFIEPMAVVEANNEIKVLRADEKDEMERILAELSASVGEFSEIIKANYECAVELNVIFSKAQLAYKMKASVPQLNDKGIIELKNARHPLISPDKVVPVNITLGKEFDTLVITGPNTGGKTVAIKTIGLLSLMAMCGLMIPVSDESKISVFENVLADIGDEQSIEQSLSTFSSHMTNIIEIQEIADDKSLILIDELGAGTDPVEGAALAMAILEDLHLKGAKIGATTHYAEL